MFHHGAHSHDPQAGLSDPALATDRGIGAIKVSFLVLLLTAVFQLLVTLNSGSVALLGDTLHNFADALTAIPLGLAFWLSRRRRDRRYTYGYGRAEDLAGAVVVAIILISALEVFYQSYQKIVHPSPVTNLGWVAAAAVIGFIGNELTAVLRLRVGREIGSAALVADGLHSQADGFTSLGVLAGVIGVWLGFPLADPLVGIVIGAAILAVTWEAARDVGYRLMDAADPASTGLIEHEASEVAGVLAVRDVRLRWIGHQQHAELVISVDGQLPTSESHRIAEAVRHELFHALPALQEIIVHIDPFEQQPGSAHLVTAHHDQPGQAAENIDMKGSANMEHFHRHSQASAGTPETEGKVIHWAPLYDAFFHRILRPSEASIREIAQIKQGDRVLDIGCGSGRLTLAAKKWVGAGGDAQGIDPSPEMIATAQRNATKAGLDVEFQIGLVESIPFPDASFDVVLSRLVMHHLPGDLKQRGLLEMRRVLKPGGVCLVVDFEPPKNAVAQHLIQNLLHPMMAEVDVRNYVPLMEKAGFTLIDAGRTSSRLLSYARGRSPQAH